MVNILSKDNDIMESCVNLLSSVYPLIIGNNYLKLNTHGF